MSRLISEHIKEARKGFESMSSADADGGSLWIASVLEAFYSEHPEVETGVYIEGYAPETYCPSCLAHYPCPDVKGFEDMLDRIVRDQESVSVS